MEKFGSESKCEQEKKRIILEIGCGNSPFFIKDGRNIKKDEHYIGVDLFPSTRQLDEDGLTPNETKDKIAKSELIQGTANFVSATGDRLPFENESVEEVIFKDIFGSPFIDSISFAERDIMDEEDESQIIIGRNKLLEEIDKRLWSSEKKDFYKDQVRTKKYGELDRRLQRLIRLYYYMSTQKKDNQSEHDIKPVFIDEAFRVLKRNGNMTIIETRTPDIALQYIDMLKRDSRFKEIPSLYNLNNFVDSNTRQNNFNVAITFQKK